MKLLPTTPMLTWWLSRLPAQVGLYGAVGMVMLALALVSLFQRQMPLERDLDDREVELDEKERVLEMRAEELAAAPAEGGVPVVGNAVRADETYTTFVREGIRLATANRLRGSQIEYRTLSEAGGRLVRYGLQFPLTGTYPDMRNFIIQISGIPGVRVESTVFSRSQINETEVSAQVQLSYLTQVKRP